MTERNALLHPREDAGQATAENGFVILDGPDGVAVTMTAEAARRTAQSLRAAAEVAQEQLAAARTEADGH